MTDRDYALWAEASLTHDGELAATLPVLPGMRPEHVPLLVRAER